ncbi:hypothetical protein JTB14_006004 [Gonioctena quinquepunctata]|nr:hypothetical protein JTB14_006004 [Gonioctena quinquepunctata]
MRPPVGSTRSPTPLVGSFSASSNTPSSPIRMGITTGSSPSPLTLHGYPHGAPNLLAPRRWTQLQDPSERALLVVRHSNFAGHFGEQSKPGSASAYTAILGDSLRFPNVADFARTLEKYPTPAVDPDPNPGDRKPGSLPLNVDLEVPTKDLLMRLLEFDPSRRLRSVRTLESIAFYKGYSFKDVKEKKV